MNSAENLGFGNVQLSLLPKKLIAATKTNPTLFKRVSKQKLFRIAKLVSGKLD